MVKILTPDFTNESDKGTLKQLVHGGYRQINVVQYHKGVISGNHYHKYNEETFYIIRGHIKLKVEPVDGSVNCREYEFRDGDMFQIHKNVLHTLIYLENSILVALYDKGVELDNGEKDICEKIK